MGLLKSPKATLSASDHNAEAAAPGHDDVPPTVTLALDEASYDALLDALAELKEFHELETSPGRASWLGEILEDFAGTIARLEPPDERAPPM